MMSISLNSTTNIESSDLLQQKINEYLETIKSERRKHNELKIIEEVLLASVAEDIQLPDTLRCKINDILMASEVEECMGLAENFTLLGLTFHNLEILNHEEKETVRKIFQEKLSDKFHSIIQGLEELNINSNKNSAEYQTTLMLNRQDDVLFGFKTKLNRLQVLYVEKLQELIDILEHFIKIRTQDLPHITNYKIQATEIKMDFYQLRSEVINTKARVDIFTETNRSVDAYREILKGIYQQQEECKQEIEKLKDLKEKYKQVSCKEYNEILKSYLQYKSNVEKKKLLYNQFYKK